VEETEFYPETLSFTRMALVLKIKGLGVCIARLHYISNSI